MERYLTKNAKAEAEKAEEVANARMDLHKIAIELGSKLKYVVALLTFHPFNYQEC
jgi:hypothetical protein